MLYPFPVRGETGGAVKPVDGTVEIVVGLPQVGGHQVWVVKRGERRAGVCGAGVEDSLGEGFEFLERGGGAALRSGWEGEGVVDKADGEALVGLQPPADVAEPGHVHGGGEEGKVGEGCVGKYLDKIARNGRWT